MEVDPEESIALNPPKEDVSADIASATLAGCERIVAASMLDGVSDGGHFDQVSVTTKDSLSYEDRDTPMPAALRIKSDVPITERLMRRLNVGPKDYGATGNKSSLQWGKRSSTSSPLTINFLHP